MPGWKYILVNGLTISRIIICPILLWLLAVDCQLLIVNCLLAAAFFTDLLDGFLARRLKVTSSFGCKLDSIADDILFCTSIMYIKFIHPDIIAQHFIPITTLSVIFLCKLLFLWYKHKTLISGFHTYLTKAAAFMQALFFLQAVFFEPMEIFFKLAFFITILALIEELVIIGSVSRLRKNIKGIFFKRNINELKP